MTNYSKFSGDDVTLNLAFKTGAGCAIDISGYEVYFKAKRNKYDTDGSAVINKCITNHTCACLGQTQIAITDTESSALKGSYYYSMQYKTCTSDYKTVDTGVITFQEKA